MNPTDKVSLPSDESEELQQFLKKLHERIRDLEYAVCALQSKPHPPGSMTDPRQGLR
jgi:hypothetical protein